MAWRVSAAIGTAQDCSRTAARVLIISSSEMSWDEKPQNCAPFAPILTPSTSHTVTAPKHHIKWHRNERPPLFKFQLSSAALSTVRRITSLQMREKILPLRLVACHGRRRRPTNKPTDTLYSRNGPGSKFNSTRGQHNGNWAWSSRGRRAKGASSTHK